MVLPHYNGILVIICTYIQYDTSEFLGTYVLGVVCVVVRECGPESCYKELSTWFLIAKC